MRVHAEFEFREGPQATRATFFGLIQWIAQPLDLTFDGSRDFVFDYKTFRAVDLGIAC